MAATQNARFRRGAHFYKQDGNGGGWKRRLFILDRSSLRYFKSASATSAKGVIDLSKARGVRHRDQCRVVWPSEAKEHLCFGIATQTRTYYLYTTELKSIQEWAAEIQRIIVEKVGKVYYDWENDVEGKLESEKSKTVRGVVQIASQFAIGVADSGILPKEDAIAMKAIATVAEGQAAVDVKTSWKERTVLGVKDGMRGLKKESPPDDKVSSMNAMTGFGANQSDAERAMLASQWPGMAGGNPMMGMAGYNPMLGMAGYNPMLGMACGNPMLGMAGGNPMLGMTGGNPMAGNNGMLGMAGSNPMLGMTGGNPMAGNNGMLGMAGSNPMLGMAGSNPMLEMAGSNNMAGGNPMLGMAGGNTMLGMAGGIPNMEVAGEIASCHPMKGMAGNGENDTGSIVPFQAGVGKGMDWQKLVALAEDLIPLYRYWKCSKSDHFYTTDVAEIGTATSGAMGRFGYKFEGIQCNIYSKQKMGTIPLYRYWAGGDVIDHFYTINPLEIGTTIKGQRGAHGYVSEGIAGYCFPTAMPGTIPLYRYYNGNHMDHFYTTNPQEIGTTCAGQIGHNGYKFEGIICYVVPYRNNH